MRRTLLAGLAAFAAAGSAFATTWSVPGAANISGRNNTHFSSDLRILNRGTATTILRFEIVLLSGEAPPAAVTRTLGAGQTFVATNALQALFGLSEKAGTVRVTADQPLLISGRTYNDADPAGTFGTNLNAVPDEELLGKGDVGHAPWVSESPDSSVGFRTNVGVFLLAPNSSVDVVLFDAAGTEKGRTTVSGGPLAFQTSVSAIVAGGLAVGRAEFQVNAGSATGFLAVNDNVTGDAIVVRPDVLATGPLDAAINGVAHAPGRENTYYVTDVRLFNPSDQAASVTVLPLSASGLPATATVGLAPGEVKEVRDALGSLFGAADGTTGSLRFQSAQPVAVLGRTSNIHRDGTPGTFGAFQTGRPFAAFPGAGTSNALIGLKQVTGSTGYRTNVGFLSGGSGVTATLVLKDASGSTLATRAGAISMGPYAWQQPSLSDLFPGVTIPQDAELEIQPTAGSVDAYASVIDNGTGDSVISAAAPFAPYSCPPPAIFTFLVNPDMLSSPGTATLTWYTNGDSISIPGVGSSLPASGSATVTASASTTFGIQASNSCGSVSGSARVVVGSPKAPLLSVPSGSPGQLVAVTPTGVPPGATVTAVTFTFPDATVFEQSVTDVTSAGDLLVYVPYVPVSQAPGYRTGSSMVSITWEDSFSPATAFTVVPLVTPADSVGTARAYFADLFIRGRDVLDQQKGISGTSDFIDGLKPLLDLYAAQMTKMLDDIAANGQATVTIDVATTDNPSPMTLAVTRADLDLFVGLRANVLASVNTLQSLTARPAQAAGGSFCLTRDDFPTVFCKGLSRINPDTLVMQGLNNLLGFLAASVDFAACAVDFAKWGAGTFVSFLTKVINIFQIVCDASPIYLDSFGIRYDNTVDPPHPAPPVPIHCTAYGAVQAHMVSKNGQSTIPNAIEQGVLLGAQAYIAKVGGNCKAALSQLIPGTYQVANPLKSFKDWIGKLLPKLPSLSPGRTIDVGPCDFDQIFLKNAKLADRREEADFQLLYGLKTGKTNLVLVPKVDSFFFLDSVPKSRRKGPYYVPIPVGQDVSLYSKLLVPTIDPTTYGCTDRVLRAGSLVKTAPDAGSGAVYQYFDVTEDTPFSFEERCAFGDGGKFSFKSVTRHTITKVDAYKWQIDQSNSDPSNTTSIVGHSDFSILNFKIGKAPPGSKAPSSQLRIAGSYDCAGVGDLDSSRQYNGCSYDVVQRTDNFYSLFLVENLTINGKVLLSVPSEKDGTMDFTGGAILGCYLLTNQEKTQSCSGRATTILDLPNR